MIIRAVPEWWRAKFHGLRTLSLPPQLPLMDGDIADLHQKADELMAVAEEAFRSLNTELPTAPVLFAAMNRITALRLMCNTKWSAEFAPVEALFVPGFREDFHAWWEAA